MSYYSFIKKVKALCISGCLAAAVELFCSSSSSNSASIYRLLLQEAIHQRESRVGRRIHSHMITTGFTPDEYLTTKLLIFYAKHGDLAAARKVFTGMPHREESGAAAVSAVVSWNAMISGCVHSHDHGLQQEALHLYYSMRSAGLKPDHFTFASVFRACASLATLHHGRRAHCVMLKDPAAAANVVVNTALLHMYFKCSCPTDGHRVFTMLSMADRNVVTWTALLSGYGQHGQVAEVIHLFYQMLDQGLRPNSVTFLALLSACAHGGLVDAGRNYFASMTRDYGIKPKGEHYAAVVDLFARAGRLSEAYEFIKSSPCEEHSVLWGALLGGCRVYGDAQLIRLAAKRFFEMQPENTGKYIVLSNTFAASEMWDDASEARQMMRKLGIKKDPAWSSIEVQGGAHTFLVGDESHEQSEEIYHTIKALCSALAEVGYVPDNRKAIQ